MSEEEIAREQQAYSAEVKRQAEELQKLIAHPGWAIYRSLIESVGQNYAKVAMEPLENVLGVTKAEFAKGTLNGLQLAATLPHHKINEAKELRNPNREEEES